MLPRKHPDRIRVAFDDHRLVANAGLILPVTLAQRRGLGELVDRHVDLGHVPGRANTGDKMLTLVASALAGGDCIDDADALRSGSTGRVLGCVVKAPSTLGTFLRSFRWGHVRQLDRVSRELLARAWAAGAGPGDGPLTIDLDSTICETYGLSKEGARHHGYTGQRGYHPLLAVAAGTGDVLMVRLREGRANTARGAAHFLRETVGRVRYAGATGQLTVRADSGFYTHAIVAVCRRMDVRFSITIRQHQSLRNLIEAIPEAHWTPIPYWMDGAADVAETSYTPFQSEPGAAPVRLIVRRVKPTPGSQLALFATYSYHAFITDRDGDTLDLETDHRRHAEIENAIRDLKYGVGLNHLPSGRFAANAAWLAVQVIAHNLARWTSRICLGEQVVTTKTLTATVLLPRRTAHPLGAPPHTAPSPPLALGKPVQWRPGPIARLAAPLLTTALATGPPSSPSSTSQSKISPTRAARIGQRDFLAAFGNLMCGSPHRQQAYYWPHPPETRWTTLLCPVPVPPPLGSVDSGLGGLPFCRSSEAPTATPPLTQTLSEREALVFLYHASGGPNWKDNTNWLSDAPLDEWHYVLTDQTGRVIGLYLNDNQLSGAIPPELGNLANLESLDLSRNQLSGEIPPELGNLTSLKYLYLNDNQLSGAIPQELGNLSKLIRLHLDENRLSGAIPLELGNLASLTALYFANNQLSGEIPPELGDLANLEWLALGGNRLGGEIPAELGSLDFLTALHLYGNRLSGCVPSGLQRQLDRDNTHLGVLPFCRGADASTATPPPAQTSSEIEALVALYHASDGPNWRNNTNWLSDKPLDEWHGVSTDSAGSVITLNLRNNQLSGEIPPELGSLAFLKYLYLNDNQLSGEIPPELGSLANLGWMNLDVNQLSGEIPPELGNLAGLDWMDLDYNQLSGTIPPELGNLGNLRGMILGGNQLSGEIPPELGNLASLEGLDLGGNQLSGAIPLELGNLSSLEVLDLGRNQLSWCVPSGLQGQLDRTYTDLGGLPFCRGSEASAPTAIPGPTTELTNGKAAAGSTPGDFASVSTGFNLTCGVGTDGSVSCWGSNNYGESTPPDGDFASVSTGAGYACGVRIDGSVACWGDDRLGHATPSEGEFASVSAGNPSACGVRTDGSVACWTDDRLGQATLPEGEFASVSAGVGYACGVRIDGSVACWGNDRIGQATPLEGKFTSVSAGIDTLGGPYACGVRTDGSVACWGDDYAGEATPPEGEFTSVSAGVRHTCGVRTDSSVDCWDDNRVRASHASGG